MHVIKMLLTFVSLSSHAVMHCSKVKRVALRYTRAFMLSSAVMHRNYQAHRNECIAYSTCDELDSFCA
jgi:hypothetical protein